MSNLGGARELVRTHAEEAQLKVIVGGWDGREYAVQVVRHLGDDDFTSPPCKAGYHALAALLRNGSEVHELAVRGELLRSGQAEAYAALQSYATGIRVVTNAEFRAAIDQVRQFSARYKLQRALKMIEGEIHKPNRSVEELQSFVAEKIQWAFARLGHAEVTSLHDSLLIEAEEMEAFEKAFEEAVRNGEPLPVRGMDTPWKALNRLIGGVLPGEVVVIAATSSSGKTAFLTQLLKHLAMRYGHGVLWSGEMTKREVDGRLACQHFGLPKEEARKSARYYEFAKEEWTKRLHIIDDCLMWPQLEAAIDAHSLSVPLKWLAQDYIGLLCEQDVKALSEVSKAAKRQAKRLGCPYFILAQLKKAVEERPDPKPQMADLRDSGQIANDANHIWMLFRESRVNPRAPKDKAAVYVRKNRDGECAGIELDFDGPTFRFLDYGTLDAEKARPAPRAPAPTRVREDDGWDEEPAGPSFSPEQRRFIDEVDWEDYP